MGQDKRNFILYAHQTRMMGDLPDDAARGRLLRALADYTFEGEVPAFGDEDSDWRRGLLEMVFNCVRRQIDSDNVYYRRKCELNRERGRMGGNKRAVHPAIANLPRCAVQ